MYSEKVLVGVPGSGSGQYVMEKVLVGVPGSGFSGSVAGSSKHQYVTMRLCLVPLDSPYPKMSCESRRSKPRS
eukprot:7389917-Prymnesium_polylepis.4